MNLRIAMPCSGCALVLILVIALLPLPALAAADLAREARWAEQIGDAIMTGDVEYLKSGDHSFMAIYTAAKTDTAKGAVIIMHGSGVHPNWADVVYPLRTRLPESGWATLSVQLPVLAADAPGGAYAPILPGVNPRLDAAMQFLKDNGHDRVAVVAHSLGCLMATYWLNGTQPADVVGFAGIGMSTASDADGHDVAAHLAKIELPVLDLYGSNDLAEVIATAPARAAGAARSGAPFQQIETAGANHFYQGQEDQLVETIAAWLDNLR